MSLEFYVDKFQNLNMNSSGGKKSPHKVCMLLAVMDLIHSKSIVSNRIELNKALKERFTHHFESFAQGNDKNTPENPFFHLRSEKFWHLAYNDGYDQSTERYSAKAVAYAYLDDELFEYIKSFITLNDLKEALATNLTNLAALYHQWLIDVGKAEKTAKNYSNAICGSITNWLVDAGALQGSLTDIKSYNRFIQLDEKARSLPAFQKANKKGNSMYSAALNSYRTFLADLTQIDVSADIRQVMENKALSETEKTAMISIRMGQGSFRKQLINMWGGCAVTGYRNPQMLLASHIKPWRKSSNEERLDKFNGLLLLANLDKVFDLGFISFDDKGKVLISDYLEQPEVLGLKPEMSFAIRSEHKPYLGYHRDELFIR